MNSKKAFIENRRKRALDFKNNKDLQEEYEEYENMKHTLSDTLYSKNSHFIYELIQNAEDNSYPNEVKAFLKFIVSDNGILTQNNEIGFNEENIKSICKFSSSSKKGKKELGFIGEKGLGFKSVFAITDKPIIVSNGYQFYFKIGEYTIPYWIENMENYPIELFNLNTTNIYLPFKKDFSYKKDIQKKIKDIEPIVLLFLKKLHNIQIIQNNKTIIDVEKRDIENINGFNKTLLKYGNIEDVFYIANKVVDRPKELEEPKRDKVRRREITLAFPSFNNTIKDDRIFSFLPTEMRTNLNFMIQADFLLTGNRESIIEENKWNKWLITEIRKFFIEVFPKLQEIYSYKYLKYFETEANINFVKKMYDELLNELRDEKLFLTKDKEWVTSSEICILDDYDFMINYLDNITYNNKFYAHKDFYIPQNLINLWEIKTIDKDNFLTLLGENKEDIACKFQENNVLFEKLIEYISEIPKYYLSNYNLSNLPLIPLDDNEMTTFESKNVLGNRLLFFKLDDNGVLNEIFDDIKCISTKYYKKLEKISFYSDDFQIKQPDLMQILENLNSDILNNIDNNVKLLVYIKNNLGNKREEIVNLLIENYGFLSKENYVVSHLYQRNSSYRYEYISPLYIAHEYLDGDNCIENIVNKYCTLKRNSYFDFISDRYLEYDRQNSDKDISNLKQEWRDFFALLNINDDLKVINEEVSMWDTDSKGDYREVNIDCPNIPFMLIFDKETSCNRNFVTQNLNIEKLYINDSIFLFKKVIQLSNIEIEYRKLENFYSGFNYKYSKIPWIEFIQNNYPIYIKNKQYKISDLYLSVDKKLLKFFHTIPKEYLVNSSSSNINKIFNLKDEPSKEDILSLIENEKLTNFNDVKSIFNYIKKYNEINLNKIPIQGKEDTLEYLNKSHLIWENGKELNLVDVKPSYGAKMKSFFIDVLGIQEKPSVEQYIEFLKTGPKKYKVTFYKFIQQLNKSLQDGESFNITSLKLCKIGSNYYSFNEIIYNDEQFKTDKIDNLLTVDKKYHSALLNISDKYNIEKMSNFYREIVINNIEDDKEIYDIYIKLLKFTWDYVFSKDVNEFESLKENREFILETQKVKNGAWANINLKIYVDEIEVDISQNIVLKDNTLYLSQNIDPRAKIKIISRYIAKQINIGFEAIELFYKDVYLLEDSYTIDEYYQNNDIQRAKENDSFESVFKKVLNDIEEELNNDEEKTENEDESECKDENSESTQTLKESLEKNQSDGKSPEVTKSKNKQTEITDDKKHTENVKKENKIVVTGHTRVVRTVRQDKDAQKQKVIIRDFLYKEYDGHCQICGDTFAYKFKNGLGEFNNFKRFSLNRGKNRDVARKGNSISLCLKHHKIFELNLHKNIYLDILKECKPLSIECLDKNNKILKEDWVSENDIEYENKIYKAFYRLKKGELFMRDNIYFLPIRLFGKDEYIKFTKAHLKEFIDVWNEN